MTINSIEGQKTCRNRHDFRIQKRKSCTQGNQGGMGMSDKPEQPAIVSEVVARPSGKTIKSEMIEKIQIKEKTMKTNVKLSIASVLLLSVGLLVSACAGPVES